MNQISLVGNLVGNDLRYTPAGRAVLESVIKGQQEGHTFYARVKSFGQSAEFLADLPEETKVLVDGRLNYSQWSVDGGTRSKVEAIANKMVPFAAGVTVEDRNKVEIEGNLARDPETHTSSSGTSFTTGVIAVNEFYRDAAGQGHKVAHYIPLTAWDGPAGEELAAARKGARLVVTGAYYQRSQEQQDGSKRYYSGVNASQVLRVARMGKAAAQAPEAAAPQDPGDMPF